MFTLLQASRFFAAAIVVLDHAAVTFGMSKYYGYVPLHGLFDAGRYGVDFFFVLSGFIICYAHWDDIAPGATQPERRLARFARRRFLRIYPTYWAVLLIALVPLYFTASRYDQNITSPLYLARLVTLLQGNGNVLTAAWTLTHEVAFYLLFGIAIWRRQFGFALLAAWFTLAALSFTVALPPSLLGHPEHLGFLVGMAGCYLIKTTRIPAPGALLALGLAGFTACYVLSGYFHVAGDLNAVLTSAQSRGPLVPLALSSLLIIVGLAELERSRQIQAPAVLRRLGDASYLLYLLHFPVLVVLIKLFHTLQAERILPLPVLFALAAGGSVVVSAAAHQWIERPLLTRLSQALGRSGTRSSQEPRPAAREVSAIRKAPAAGEA